MDVMDSAAMRSANTAGVMRLPHSRAMDVRRGNRRATHVSTIIHLGTLGRGCDQDGRAWHSTAQHSTAEHDINTAGMPHQGETAQQGKQEGRLGNSHSTAKHTMTSAQMQDTAQHMRQAGRQYMNTAAP
jgi:hypothetical protein